MPKKKQTKPRVVNVTNVTSEQTIKVPVIAVPNEIQESELKEYGKIPVTKIEKIPVVKLEYIKEQKEVREVRIIRKLDMKRILESFGFNMPDLGITNHDADWHFSITDKDITFSFETRSGQRRTAKL